MSWKKSIVLAVLLVPMVAVVWFYSQIGRMKAELHAIEVAAPKSQAKSGAAGAAMQMPVGGREIETRGGADSRPIAARESGGAPMSAPMAVSATASGNAEMPVSRGPQAVRSGLPVAERSGQWEGGLPPPRVASRVRSGYDLKADLRGQMQRFFDRFEVQEDKRARVVEIMAERTTNYSAGVGGNDFRKGYEEEVAREVGPELASKLIEARYSLSYHSGIVNEFVRRSLAAGVPVSTETADEIAIAFIHQAVLMTYGRPTELSSDYFTMYTRGHERALRTVRSLLNPAQVQELKGVLDAQLALVRVSGP